MGTCLLKLNFLFALFSLWIRTKCALSFVRVPTGLQKSLNFFLSFWRPGRSWKTNNVLESCWNQKANAILHYAAAAIFNVLSAIVFAFFWFSILEGLMYANLNMTVGWLVCVYIERMCVYCSSQSRAVAARADDSGQCQTLTAENCCLQVFYLWNVNTTVALHFYIFTEAVLSLLTLTRGCDGLMTMWDGFAAV